MQRKNETFEPVHIEATPGSPDKNDFNENVEFVDDPCNAIIKNVQRFMMQLKRSDT